LILHGLTLTEAAEYAKQYSEENDLTCISFEDEDVIAGCATVGVELLEDIPETKIDYILFSMSSGSLASGIGSYFKQLSPETK